MNFAQIRSGIWVFALLLGAAGLVACDNQARGNAAPSAPAPVQAGPLSTTQLQKLIELSKTMGGDAELTPDIAQALGIGLNGKAIPTRQLSVVRNDVDAVSFNQFLDRRDRYIFAGRNSTGTYVFLVDGKLDLVAAAKRHDPAPAASIPVGEAKSIYLSLMSLWAQFADNPPVADEPPAAPAAPMTKP
jgi:hypothetical protein